MFISSLRKKIQNVSAPTTTHAFIKMLQDSGRLVRNYTQNIDGLEERLGMSSDLLLGPGSKTRFSARVQREQRLSSQQSYLDTSTPAGVSVVQLHGSLAELRCGLCHKTCSWDEDEHVDIISSGQAPDCPSCTEYNKRRTGRGRRGLAVGRLRPDIVLYGEEHPKGNLIGPLITHDLALAPDILLILGTSLKVHGLKVVVKEFAKTIHDRGGRVVFVNRTKPPEGTWGEFIDYWVGWDCDEWVSDLKERRPDVCLAPGSQQEEQKERRQSSGGPKEPRKYVSRPQATRDDQKNGCYHTFKILDILGKIADVDGGMAKRPVYWQDLRRLTGDARDVSKPRKTSMSRPLPSTTNAAAKSSSRTTTTTTTKSKSAPARKPLPISKTPANTSKKRKSYSSLARDEKNLTAIAIWQELREHAPGLSEYPPECTVRTRRLPLLDLQQNMHSYLKPFSHGRSGALTKYKQSSPSYIPNLSSFESRMASMPNLTSHPPSGLDIAYKTPKQPLPRPSHAYGTRSVRRFSEDSTIIVQSEPKSQSQKAPAISRLSYGSTCSNETTIVVEAPLGYQEPSQEPTPPDSAPMTPEPDSQRIKRMGSIGAILSSPNMFESAEESPDTRSSLQEFFDASTELD